MMREEMIQRYNKELLEGLFVPRINYSQSTRGRQRSHARPQVHSKSSEPVNKNSTESFQVLKKRKASVFDFLMQDAVRREKHKAKMV